ncbi:MAG TPA: tetratricopeptide repeat protein, partial [Terriglobales bacterium]|nr:tetratricopeptide repeat protein [Terriglobales bacterium]
LRQAIRLQPDFLGAHSVLASVLREAGDTAGAAAEARATQEIMKQQTSLQGAVFATNSGIRLLNAGDLEGAIGQFERAVQLSAKYAPAHLQLGQALARKGEQAQARLEFQKAKQLDPQLQVPKL